MLVFHPKSKFLVRKQQKSKTVNHLFSKLRTSCEFIFREDCDLISKIKGDSLPSTEIPVGTFGTKPLLSDPFPDIWVSGTTKLSSLSNKTSIYEVKSLLGITFLLVNTQFQGKPPTLSEIGCSRVINRYTILIEINDCIQELVLYQNSVLTSEKLNGHHKVPKDYGVSRKKSGDLWVSLQACHNPWHSFGQVRSSSTQKPAYRLPLIQWLAYDYRESLSGTRLMSIN